MSDAVDESLDILVENLKAEEQKGVLFSHRSEARGIL
jgi:hypothetical protein